MNNLLPETIFNENITKLNAVYSTLIKGDTNPGLEAELRVEIIDIISNIEAAIIGEKSSNEEFIVLLAKLREDILSWNTHGSIFKQQIGLVDLFNELFFKAKSVVFGSAGENNNFEATRLKKELASMKSELGDLKDLINSLMKEKSTAKSVDPSQQTIVEEPKQEVEAPVKTEEATTKSQLPWKRQPKPETSEPEPPVMIPEINEEPPVLLPIITDEAPEQITEEIQTPPVVEEITALEEPIIDASATIQKLSEDHKPESEPAHIIDQMKSIITEAEVETQKDISAFKEQMEEELKPPVIDPTPQVQIKEQQKISPPIIESPVVETKETQIEVEQETPIIPPTEPLVEEEIPEEPDTDPYMQLLTLEAEKYRLEKEIEKNETDFQEGLKNKQEFDENIKKINDDLTKVRDQIDLLRKQLTA